VAEKLKQPGTILFRLGTILALWHYAAAPWWLLAAILLGATVLNLPGAIAGVRDK